MMETIVGNKRRLLLMFSLIIIKGVEFMTYTPECCHSDLETFTLNFLSLNMVNEVNSTIALSQKIPPHPKHGIASSICVICGGGHFFIHTIVYCGECEFVSMQLASFKIVFGKYETLY